MTVPITDRDLEKLVADMDAAGGVTVAGLRVFFRWADRHGLTDAETERILDRYTEAERFELKMLTEKPS